MAALEPDLQDINRLREPKMTAGDEQPDLPEFLLERRPDSERFAKHEATGFQPAFTHGTEIDDESYPWARFALVAVGAAVGGFLLVMVGVASVVKPPLETDQPVTALGPLETGQQPNFGAPNTAGAGSPANSFAAGPLTGRAGTEPPYPGGMAGRSTAPGFGAGLAGTGPTGVGPAGVGPLDVSQVDAAQAGRMGTADQRLGHNDRSREGTGLPAPYPAAARLYADPRSRSGNADLPAARPSDLLVIPPELMRQPNEDRPIRAIGNRPMEVLRPVATTVAPDFSRSDPSPEPAFRQPSLPPPVPQIRPGQRTTGPSTGPSMGPTTTGPTDGPTAGRPTATSSTVYTIQLGYYRQRSNAQRFYDKVRRQGYPAEMIEDEWRGEPRFAIIVGRYLEESSAAADAERLTSRAGLDTYVRPRKP